MTGNHVNHPNDFMVRVYAQAVLATLGVYELKNGLFFVQPPFHHYVMGLEKIKINVQIAEVKRFLRDYTRSKAGGC
jgi:hypothetical protein